MPGDNAFQEFRNDAPGRNRFYSRSIKTRRSARSQNVSDLSDSFILRCIGPSSYSCQGRCSIGWDKGPTVERLQCFCDAYCENFNDCCADFDLYCQSPPNLLTPQDVGLNSTHVLPNITIARKRQSTILLQANESVLFESKNFPSKALLTSAPQPLMTSLTISPSTAYKTITVQETRTIASSGFLKTQRREAPDERWKCVRDGHANKTSGIWMLAACPKHWPADMTRKQCEQAYRFYAENFQDMIPVSDHHGNIYKNRHCAKCNLAEVTEIDPFELDVACMVTPPQYFSRSETLRFLLKYCPRKIKWKARDGQQRRYCTSIYSSCLETSPYYRNCTIGSSRIVYNYRKNFKNVFCAKCHDQSTSKLTCGPRTRSPRDRYFLGQKFTVLLDVTESSNSRLVAVSCPKGMVYDVHLEICRKGEIKVPKTARLDRYRVLMWLLASKRIGRITKQDFQRPIASAFSIKTKNIITLNCFRVGEIFLVKLEFEFQSNQIGIKTGNILEFTQELSISVRNVSLTIFKITFRLINCVQVQTFSPSQYTVIFANKSSMVFIKASKEILRQKDYYAEETEIKDGVLVPTGNITVCGKRLTRNCSGTYILLENTEYTIMSNGSLFRNASNKLYTAHSYYTGLNNSVWVCSAFERIYWKEEKRVDELIFLAPFSIAGLSISITCLLIVLVTYLKFKELRTVPGIHVINLSITLLIAHFLWLLTNFLNTSKASCALLAIFLHYFFLVSFAWMSIIAYDTWRAFSCQHWYRARGISCKMHSRVTNHVVFGWLPALIFVAICVALDQSNAVTIGYGGNMGCWINNRVANICIFTTPVAVSLVINALFFLRTIKAIRKTKSQTLTITDTLQNTSSFAIFARIAALMGFSWIFGFLAMFISKYLWYPFAILTSSQGVYIAVAFVFTSPRVRRLYCNFIRVKRDQKMVRSLTGRRNVRPLTTFLLTAVTQIGNDSDLLSTCAAAADQKKKKSFETQL